MVSLWMLLQVLCRRFDLLHISLSARGLRQFDLVSVPVAGQHPVYEWLCYSEQREVP